MNSVNKEIITIVGAGMMGSAMAFPAFDNGHEVRLVGTPLDREIIDGLKKNGHHKTLKRDMPQGVKFYQIEELQTALDGATLLIGGVSSFGVDWFCDEVLSVIPESLPVISITKGLHCASDGSITSFPAYMKKKSGRNLCLNAIGGPCISFELADRHNTLVAFCGEDEKMLEKIRGILKTPYYHIDLTTDIIGLETAVAMKNAYALGVALAIGAAEHDCGVGCPEHYNPQAGLFAQSVREMRTILEVTGGNADKIVYGAGDLYVTVFGGRTRKIGTLLGRGMTIDEALVILDGVTLESIAVTKAVIGALEEKEKRGEFDMTRVPLLSHIKELVTGLKTVDIPWEKF